MRNRERTLANSSRASRLEQEPVKLLSSVSLPFPTPLHPENQNTNNIARGTAHRNGERVALVGPHRAI